MQFVDLYPHGCFVIQTHYFSLTYPLGAWSPSIFYKNYKCFIFLMATHPPSPGSGIPFSAIQSLGWSILPCQGFLAQEELPIMCMIQINSLQELLMSPLPCGHSPSRPRLRHPLLCYTIPRVIHLSLSMFSCTWITQRFYRALQLRHP